MEKLAINGGTPVRKQPLPPYYPGATVYDGKEAGGASEVVFAQSPYRYYGPHCLGKTKQFERELAEKVGTQHALAVSSGTAAVVVALKAAGIGAGDKVIVPACTFIATAGAVVCAGAVPVFADIDESMNMDPTAWESLIDEHTKAVIPVPILGNPCRMDEIMEVANRHGILVIEDAAQSCGATYHGKHVGTFGHINTYSLQINKIITTGEGGAVVTDDEKLYERAVRYHDQGMYREKEGFLNTDENADVFVGQNYRLSEIAGAVALEQVRKLDDIIASMNRIKYSMKNRLRGIPGLSFRAINDEKGDAGNALIFLLETGEKALSFCKALQAEGVSCSQLYNGEPIYMQPQLLHRRTADASGFPFNQFPEVKYTREMCPRAVDILSRNVDIMVGPTWTRQDADDVVAAVKKVAAQVL